MDKNSQKQPLWNVVTWLYQEFRNNGSLWLIQYILFMRVYIWHLPFSNTKFNYNNFEKLYNYKTYGLFMQRSIPFVSSKSNCNIYPPFPGSIKAQRRGDSKHSGKPWLASRVTASQGKAAFRKHLNGHSPCLPPRY